MLQRTDWPPNYRQIKEDRAAHLRILHQVPDDLRRAKRYYKKHHIEFIEDWCETFDPRNAGTDRPTTMPFRLFQRQREFLEFLWQCYLYEAHGLVEKSRDMGATWLCVAFSVWLFLFVDGVRIGWGSRKAANVDKIGDMDSIFEKMRFQMRSIPRCFWPSCFSEDHMAFMKIYASKFGGASITGESGDDIGRGGRTRMYFKDESAHYEHPELIEAALSDTTRVQIDISSVNGLGNVFHRKREAGVEWTPGKQVVKGQTNVFVMDWTDHPDKTYSWYKERETKAIADGLLHVFRQEVDRNYASSVEGVVIPAEWVKSAIDAHIILQFEERERDVVYAGLDVADGGGDRNALAIREGVILRSVEQWGDRDVGVTTRRAIDGIASYAILGRRERTLRGVELEYDCVGVGAAVKAEYNRLVDEGLVPKGLALIAWNAGAVTLNPDRRVIDGDNESPLNKDFYRNLKAQGWWELRRRFERTHRAVTDGVKFDQDELISLPSDLPLLRSLQKELSQPTMSKDSRMRLVIDKQPEGTRSPNLADGVVMAYWPVLNTVYDSSMEWV
jgi:phage terminase large subunit